MVKEYAKKLKLFRKLFACSLLAIIVSASASLAHYCHDFGEVITVCSHDGFSKRYVEPDSNSEDAAEVDHPCCAANANGKSYSVTFKISAPFTRTVSITRPDAPSPIRSINSAHRPIRAPPETSIS